MNERIKSLLALAHLDVMEDLGDIDTNVVAERFAELIIRECIAQCNDGDSRWFIAQHFGVEE